MVSRVLKLNLNDDVTVVSTVHYYELISPTVTGTDSPWQELEGA